MLQELDTVGGLASKNGTLIEAYVYDAYGKVKIWTYGRHDYDRDGDVEGSPDNDYNEMLAAYQGTPNPCADADNNGLVDIGGMLDFLNSVTGPRAVREEYTSTVGNPYFFTGRRLHFVEDLTQTGATRNKQVPCTCESAAH